ncbi:MAG: hypothetical protein QGI10_14440 [Vicinamibacterales bacterium]|jgi:hypothetical protein|nr:hypothetical protein [Vicinamibacterales bacterium]MDP7480460.1 hypothetical protein [Vicinamibacterales bacterium]MDP7691901.1 hypothetical protein [Vicinamibacterales bacterium]HJN45857.1 hypothetical protein [Vicinamibacterales bacterium]
MTAAQRIVLSLGMLIFSLMGLMPPWVHVRDGDPSARVPAGYAFITIGAPIRPAEPDGQDDTRRRGRFRRTYRGAPLQSWSSEIDAPRLSLQWGTVTVATGGVIWLLGSTRRRRRGDRPDAARTHGPSHPR